MPRDASRYALANPAAFMRLSGRALPWLAGLSGLTLAVCLVFASPADERG